MIITWYSRVSRIRNANPPCCRLENFVDYLYDIIAEVNDPRSRMLRFYACESLHELESWYSGLLFPLLGTEWRPFHIPFMTEDGGNGGFCNAIAESNLQTFVNDELLHIAEAYSRLFLLVFDHFTREVISSQLAATQEGVCGLEWETGTTDGGASESQLSAGGSTGYGLATGSGTSSSSSVGHTSGIPGTVSSHRSGPGSAYGGSGMGALGGPMEDHDGHDRDASDSECSSPDRYIGVNGEMLTRGGGEFVEGRPGPGGGGGLNDDEGEWQGGGGEDRTYKLPSYAKKVPHFDATVERLFSSTNGDSCQNVNVRKLLPRRMLRLLTRSISLVLEAMPSSSSWGKIHFAKRLSFFIHLLKLQTSVVYHHFAPLVHSSSAALIHALLIVTRSSWASPANNMIGAGGATGGPNGGVGQGVQQPSDPDLVCCAMLDRLFSLVQDVFVDPFFRGITTQWLVRGLNFDLSFDSLSL